MASTSNQTISSFQCPITFDFDPTNITNVPSSVVPSWISLVAINATTSAPTVLINLLIIWTVLEKKELRSNSYYLVITVLSFSDLLVGLVVQPLFAALGICVILQYPCVCELTVAYSVTSSLCCGWSAVTMVIVSLERYLFIEHPLYYHLSVTSKKLMTITGVSWIAVGISKVFTRFLTDKGSFWMRQLPMLLTLGPTFVIKLFCITKINLTARRQVRAIAAQQQSVAKPQSIKIKEYKQTFPLVLVLASVVCFCLMLILKIVGAAVRGNWSDDFRYVFQAFCFTLMHVQSIFNPVIYSLRLSDIRTGVAKKLRSLLKCRVNN